MQRMVVVALCATVQLSCGGGLPVAGEACALERGVDACGAGSFCARFDERTIASCHALGSRQLTQACGADNHCESKSCKSGLCAAASANGNTTYIPPVQGPSEACDPTYGIDACGAGLFCAAFDGRKLSTCYFNKSRTKGQTCALSEHCTTNTCASGVCAGAPFGAPCQTDFDCASNSCSLSGRVCDT